jgi:hypothetical protein
MSQYHGLSVNLGSGSADAVEEEIWLAVLFTVLFTILKKNKP